MSINIIINPPIAPFRTRPSEYGSCPKGVRTHVLGSTLNILAKKAQPNAEKDEIPIIHMAAVIMLAVLSSILYMLSFLHLIAINNSILEKIFQYRSTYLSKNKSSIKAVPARISQKDKKFLIEELDIEGGK